MSICVIKQCTPFSQSSYEKYGITFLFLAFFFFFVSTGYTSTHQDTIPPTYKWISPENFSILTTNTIRLCVDAHDNKNGSGIKKVVFYASYIESRDRSTSKHFIGDVNIFPYEFMWDCSNIPDQRINNLAFFCDVIDNAGNVSSIERDKKNKIGPRVVLDRNPVLKDIQLLSHLIERDIFIDGNLNEWAAKDSIVFSNNDNKIVVYSSWDKKNLYFGILVEDKSIISHFGPGSENQDGMFHEDVIEIYLDVDHDHFEIRHFNDRHFGIFAAGMIYDSKFFLSQNEYTRLINIFPNVKYKVNIEGTLNDEKDNDNCYIIEFAVSWEELGINPENKISMGLEIWNNDMDYVDGNYFYSGWTTTAPNMQNPSEWGNIVFIGSNNFFNTALVIVIVLTCSTLVLLIILSKRIYRSKYKKIVTNDETSKIAD